MTVAEELLTRVLELPEHDRGMIAREILLSLDSEVDDVSQEEWNAAWSAEIQRRRNSIREGKSKLDHWSDVKARLMNEFAAEPRDDSSDQ